MQGEISYERFLAGLAAEARSVLSEGKMRVVEYTRLSSKVLSQQRSPLARECRCLGRGPRVGPSRDGAGQAGPVGGWRASALQGVAWASPLRSGLLARVSGPTGPEKPEHPSRDRLLGFRSGFCSGFVMGGKLASVRVSGDFRSDLLGSSARVSVGHPSKRSARVSARVFGKPERSSFEPDQPAAVAVDGEQVLPREGQAYLVR